MSVQIERLKKGWTQEQLAIVSGVSVRTIQRIERGETASIDSLKALAAAFNIDFQILKDPTMDTNAVAAAHAPAIDAEMMLALDHVRRKRRFFGAIAAYVVIVPVLIGLNVAFSPKYLWALWPAGIWALVLVLSAVRLSGWSPFGPAWEKRELERRLGRPL